MMGRRASSLIVAALLLAACSLQPVDIQAPNELSLRSTIRAADGSILARLFIENRAIVSIDRMPSNLIRAVLAAEDARFFEHNGFDLRAALRAAIVNARAGETLQGGSTITQQYVKNVFFRSPDKTLTRKVRELRLAIELEKTYPKREILEKYLNTVYLGEGAYGMQAGAETYFGKNVSELTLPEAALLAALIKAPALYDPRDHPRAAKARRDYVIDRMVILDFISRNAGEAAIQTPVRITPAPPRIRTRQPYFVEAVKRELMADKRLGSSDRERAATIFRGGLQVETTLEPDLQLAAERAVAAVLPGRKDPSAALVAIRPKTGEIVAMVGGRDWKTSQVNLAMGRAGGGSGRQPGSAFKPIALAAALERGLSLDTRYDSSSVVFRFADGSSWPVGGGGYGPLSLGEAIVDSVNSVFARLAVDIGAGAIVNQAHLMGIRARLPSYPSIALGSAEVSVLDMAAAYATLANYGTAIEPTTIKRITMPSGVELDPEQRRFEGAVSPGNAYLINRALEQVIARGTGVAAQIGRPAAGKTGTTNDYADAWFVGYTPDLVTAVWVGYPQGRIPMLSVQGIRVLGGTFPAEIWKRFMIAALEDTPPHAFVLPQGELVTVRINPETGLLAAPWCRGEKRRMVRDLVPTMACPYPVQPVPEPIPAPKQTTDRGREREERSTPEPALTPKTTPEPEPKETSTPEPEPEPTPTEGG